MRGLDDGPDGLREDVFDVKPPKPKKRKARETISVVCRTGSRSVVVRARGGKSGELAIHEYQGWLDSPIVVEDHDFPWTLTHVPTGHAVGHFSTLQAAKKALGICAKWDWSIVVEPQDAKNLKDDFLALQAALGDRMWRP
jgi:hypothetical protein